MRRKNDAVFVSTSFETLKMVITDTLFKYGPFQFIVAELEVLL